MITAQVLEQRRAREAQRALMRRQLVDEWQVLPKLASALLDERTAVAAARGLEDHGGAYWIAADRWLRERAHRGG